MAAAHEYIVQYLEFFRANMPGAAAQIDQTAFALGVRTGASADSPP